MSYDRKGIFTDALNHNLAFQHHPECGCRHCAVGDSEFVAVGHSWYLT